MYVVEGINRELWQLAKSNKEIDFETIKDVVQDYSESEHRITDYSCYELALHCIGDAIQAGVVKRHMFVDAMKNVWIHPLFEGFLGKDDRSIELKLVQNVFNMIRYTQVMESDGTILIDFR